MSNQWVKTVKRKLSPSHIEKVATIAELRQEAASEIADIGLFTAGDARGRVNDSNRKRREALNTAKGVVKDSLLFTERERQCVIASDGKGTIAGKDKFMKASKEANKIWRSIVKRVAFKYLNIPVSPRRTWSASMARAKQSRQHYSGAGSQP